MAEVLTLQGQPVVENDRKSLFMQAVAESFDQFVQDNGGRDPEAVVYVLGGIGLNCRVGWQMIGKTQGAGAAMLSFATMALTKEVLGLSDRPNPGG